MMLQNRRNDTGKREPGAVQRVDEARLAAVRRLVSNVGASSLKVSEVAARRHLEPLADARRKGFQVVSMRAREPGVAGGQSNNPIWQLQQLKNLFGVRSEELELVTGSFRRDEPHQLDLVEFVDAQQTSGVFAGGAGFASEARRICGNRFGQIRGGQNLVAEEIGQRDFSGGNEEGVLVLQRVHVLLELRQLRRSRHAGAIDDDRDPGFLVSVLASVEVEHKVHQRPHEGCALIAEYDEPRSADLGAALEIDDAESSPNLPMRLDARAFTGSAPCPYDGVVFFAAGRHLVECDVRQLEENSRQLGLSGGELAVEPGYFLTEGA